MDSGKKKRYLNVQYTFHFLKQHVFFENVEYFL